MAQLKPLPPLEELHNRFWYDPETGFLHHKHAKPGVFKDEFAGCKNKRGYIQVNINRKTYQVHRIVWYMQTGEDPGVKGIDHRNGLKHDNRFENLRVATSKQNNWNKPRKLGEQLPSGNYRVRIMDDGKLTHLGTYKTLQEATDVYNAKALELRGEFAYQEWK